MSVRVLAGDCLEILPALTEASVDACVTDPPYHLTNNTGSRSPNPGQYTPIGKPKEPKGGFMGKQWDGGDIAFRPEIWRQVFRVLKPGGHLVAFGGSRTYHRLACAIEDAGFEIRDQIMWIYGSGFPKSLDVSKAIDRAGGKNIAWFGAWLRQERMRRGISQKDLAEAGGFYDKINHGGLVANWELGYGIPSAAEFNKVCSILNLDFERIEEVEREVLGKRKVNAGVAFTSEGPTELPITAPATDAARKWQGFGTALKPAHEPIVLARKPLIGTVAANVLAHGTGALNIDGCRVEHVTVNGGNLAENPHLRKHIKGGNTEGRIFPKEDDARFGVTNPSGRWPANVILSYPEDEYMIRSDITENQKRELYRWLSENA